MIAPIAIGSAIVAIKTLNPDLPDENIAEV
jgi:hypothetical protein